MPSWYVSDNSPNNGSFFREQSLSIQKSGHNILIFNGLLLGRRDFLNLNFKVKTFMDEGMMVFSHVTPSFGLARIKQLLVKIYYSRIEHMYKLAVMNGFKIDLIHAHSFMPSGFCACHLGKKYNIPVVVTEHSSGVLSKRITSFEVKCLKKSIKDASAFICVSEALRKSVLGLTETRKKITVIPNMVSPTFTYRDPKYLANGFIFFSLGNLVKSKRFDLAIKSFVKAFKGIANVKLFIGGDGPKKATLEKLIRIYEIDTQVKLIGHLTRKEVIEQMHKCNVFLLPSDYETFGVVYIEALACGKPVIGTKNGGAESIINKKNGIIVSKGNIEQLKEAMMYIYNNYNAYDKHAISRECIETYGERNHLVQLFSVYNNVLIPR